MIMGNLKIIIWSRRLILSNNLRKFSPSHIRTYGSRAYSFTTRMKKKDLLLAGVSLYNPHQRDSDQRLSHWSVNRRGSFFHTVAKTAYVANKKVQFTYDLVTMSYRKKKQKQIKEFWSNSLPFFRTNPNGLLPRPDKEALSYVILGSH